MICPQRINWLLSTGLDRIDTRFVAGVTRLRFLKPFHFASNGPGAS
jgi:hypothetical protein